MSTQNVTPASEVAIMAARLRRVLRPVADATSITASAATLEVLMAVASNEDTPVLEIARKLEAPATTVSRQLLDLWIKARDRYPGFGLVEPVADPLDMRIKRYRLTIKGKALMTKVQAVMYGTPSN